MTLKIIAALFFSLQLWAAPVATKKAVVADGQETALRGKLRDQAREKARGMNREGGVCKLDREKFCPGAKRGEGIQKCLCEQADKLSLGCKEMIYNSAFKNRHRKECNDDLQKFCAKLAPCQSKLIQCLLDNKAKLAPGCQKKLEQAGRIKS